MTLATMPMIALATLNNATPEAFATALDGVFEHAPWVPAAAAQARPFASVTALHVALMAGILAAGRETQRAFLRGHPPLSVAAAIPAGLTPDSRSEQAGLGLAGLGPAGVEFEAGSAEYQRRFAIPFIICARRHTPASVLAVLTSRLASTPEAEIDAALAEVFLISRLRLAARVTGPGMPRVTGRLAAGVRDDVCGRPVQGLRVALLREGAPAADTVTDAEGRAVLLDGEPLRIGTYELLFHVGAHFAAGEGLRWPDVVPVRFAIAEAEGDHHIALRAAPGRYSVQCA